MGKAIKDKSNIANISEQLFEYCKSSHDIITSFGGTTIFAGGDDLLFFAPIINKDKTKTIFDLCDEIDKNFNINKATLSFGIHISYEKFPLYEALEESRNLLFVKAKSEPKNNIAFRVRKHSGQTFQSVVHKGHENIYNTFLKISSSIEDGDGVDNFLHSLHHKINSYKTTLEQIADDKDRVKNFFDNYFNNDVHKQYEKFFEQLIDYIYEIYQEDSIEKEDKLNLVYATLRFVKFVKGDKQ
jgi:CRISPR-associated protein Cmr2